MDRLAPFLLTGLLACQESTSPQIPNSNIGSIPSPNLDRVSEQIRSEIAEVDCKVFKFDGYVDQLSCSTEDPGRSASVTVDLGVSLELEKEPGVGVASSYYRVSPYSNPFLALVTEHGEFAQVERPSTEWQCDRLNEEECHWFEGVPEQWTNIENFAGTMAVSILRKELADEPLQVSMVNAYDVAQALEEGEALEPRSDSSWERQDSFVNEQTAGHQSSRDVYVSDLDDVLEHEHVIPLVGDLPGYAPTGMYEDYSARGIKCDVSTDLVCIAYFTQIEFEPKPNCPGSNEGRLSVHRSARALDCAPFRMSNGPFSEAELNQGLRSLADCARSADETSRFRSSKDGLPILMVPDTVSICRSGITVGK